MSRYREMADRMLAAIRGPYPHWYEYDEHDGYSHYYCVAAPDACYATSYLENGTVYDKKFFMGCESEMNKSPFHRIPGPPAAVAEREAEKLRAAASMEPWEISEVDAEQLRKAGIVPPETARERGLPCEATAGGDAGQEPKCPQCGGPLTIVKKPPGSPWNDDQFDSMKAGDFLCPVCPDNQRAKNGKCYWWKHEVHDAEASREIWGQPENYWEDKYNSQSAELAQLREQLTAANDVAQKIHQEREEAYAHGATCEAEIKELKEKLAEKGTELSAQRNWRLESISGKPISTEVERLESELAAAKAELAGLAKAHDEVRAANALREARWQEVCYKLVHSPRGRDAHVWMYEETWNAIQAMPAPTPAEAAKQGGK